jgi:hypothetical protein
MYRPDVDLLHMPTLAVKNYSREWCGAGQVMSMPYDDAFQREHLELYKSRPENVIWPEIVNLGHRVLTEQSMVA